MLGVKGYSVLHDAIECLIGALEARDPYSHGHSQRVADLAFDLARQLGFRGKQLETTHVAAHLHDIGKIGVPDSILCKRGKLFPHEWAQIRRHPEIGYQILSRSHRLKDVAKTVLHHHERWDGKGYPAGLRGETIPLGARLIAVCDSIDAMTSDRPYRAALSLENFLTEIEAGMATQFDPVVVDAAMHLWSKQGKRYFN